ncbi:MAG: DEAD/DEAH box helicase [Hyphomicrobiaceae bacterium]
MTLSDFDGLGLAEPLIRALSADGYERPTPIQRRAIPSLLEGRDLLGIAQTGTGKTAAFALPILHHLSAFGGRPEARRPRALILAPTRELASQIGASFTAYGRNMRLTHFVIFGGVGQGPQVQAIEKGVDVLIATPGRLLDLATQHAVRFDDIMHLVLDEADRMLDMGFIRDIRKIVAMLPKERQTILTSATMAPEITRLAHDILKDPVRVEVSPQGQTVDAIEQRVHFVDAGAKRALLASLLQDNALSRVIVFTRTKHGANRVTQSLAKAGIAAEAIHGNKSQNARERALQLFKGGRVRVLVATDIAARGLDIDDVTHVVNFDVPNEPESYVHRIGRTARAGATGTAVTFCAPDERGHLKDIERLIRRPLKTVDTKVSVPAAERAASSRPTGEQPRPAQVRAAPKAQQHAPKAQPQRGGNGNGNGKPGGGGGSSRSRRRRSRPHYAHSVA